jgi:hypothetical protein
MLLNALVLAAAAMVPTLARTTFNMTRSCDTPQMKDVQLEFLKAAAAQAAEMQNPSNPSVAAISDSPKVNVTVYVHVVAGGKTFDEGWVSVDAPIPSQPSQPNLANTPTSNDKSPSKSPGSTPTSPQAASPSPSPPPTTPSTKPGPKTWTPST